MADEDVTSETQGGQPEAMRGEGVQPADLGYSPPDTGEGEAGESEIPKGVDALDPEKVEAAQSAAAEEEESGGGALDVSALMEDGGGDADADADAGAAADASGEAEADAEAGAAADASGEADAEAGAAADASGDDAPVKTDAEAQTAPDTDEDA